MIRIARLLPLFRAVALIVGLAGDVTAEGRDSNPKDKPAPAHAGSEARVPYKATYAFYHPAAS